MPIYEFRCRVCDERFELRRPMRDADAPAACGRGHEDTTRLLPVFAAIGALPSPTAGCGQGAGCCGGACGPA